MKNNGINKKSLRERETSANKPPGAKLSSGWFRRMWRQGYADATRIPVEKPTKRIAKKT